MVLQRRLDYGFSGYEVPVVPRGSRSARGKVPIRKTRENYPVCAFEILASVAGELLQETEIFATNAACGEDQYRPVEQEKEGKGKLLKTEPPERETCKENGVAHVPGLQGHHQICAVNQNASGSCFPGDFHHRGEFVRGYDISAVETKSEAGLSVTRIRQLEKICFATKWPFVNSRNSSRVTFGKGGGDSRQYGEFFRGLVDNVKERKSVNKSSIIRSIKNRQVKGCLTTKELHWKPPALVSSESNSTASLLTSCKTCHTFCKCCGQIEVDSRNDDETFVRCTEPHTMVTTYRPSSNAVDRRIRNLSESRHYKAAPKMKDWKRKPVYCNGRPCYTRQISRRISHFKRRKLFNQIPLSTSDGGFHCQRMFNPPYKSSIVDNCQTAGASSTVTGPHVTPEMKSRDCTVKLCIKSLKVPELFIEIPATATVGSLKSAVVEAVTNILEDGLHVGVLLQGKTVRDDSKTLLQTGICHDNKHRRLGFVLEPNHPQITPSPRTEGSPLVSGGTCEGLTGHTVSLPVQPAAFDITPLPLVLNSGCSVHNKYHSVHSLDDILIYSTVPDSQALVAVPAVSMEALAMVPKHQKPRHHEFVQRRTRRPFSVSEVESLVQAVEKLGTGRWRDIKFCAFDNAKHRTYVDLKDKWKTLLHTARISPQQRRGEPVPQQILDRVLVAHGFWSQQHAVKLEV